MKRYEQLAQDIAEMIRTGVLAPGRRVPSVRKASEAHGVSPATVFQAYYLLENQGLIRSRPKSGYFVCGQPTRALPTNAVAKQGPASTPVEVSELVFSIMSSIRDPRVVPLGSAFPSPTLFPLQRLAKSLAKTTRLMDLRSLVVDLPPGNEHLRRQIALRYGVAGISAPIEELVITSGALEALNLCLQVVTKPGDLVAIESPTFYACLQALERLQLRAVEIPVSPTEGIEIDYLRDALSRYPIKACWFMPHFQNPMGASLSSEKKQSLVALLQQYQVPLIEDDVYGELYFGATQPLPAKAFDQQGLVLHCGSFSKSLAPGYRVGWVAAGKYAQQVERLKLMTTLSASIPAQAAIADYLQFGDYDRHLRKLRYQLEAQQNHMRADIEKYFPANTRISRPAGGYFLWLQLPGALDSLHFFSLALAAGISIAPGPIFSATQDFRHCIRLNYGYPWGREMEQAMQTLGEIAHTL